MNDWKPGLYLQYSAQRTQPAIDLAARIGIESPKRILDIGCGPGNSTAVLKKRWPDGRITGLDSSPAMIGQASDADGSIEWICADASSDLRVLGRFDIVFSNAAIQWMPEHEVLLPNFFSLLEPGGALAVQVPDTSRMPIHLALRDLANGSKWNLRNTEGTYSMHPAPYYYDILSTLSQSVELWETQYYHPLANHRALVEWFGSTGLRPYLQRLKSDEDQAEFLADFESALQTAYPRQADGCVLFPFDRIFFIAYQS